MRLSDQNNPSKHGFFRPFLQKNAKTQSANYNNINTLHFCILHFENVEECTLYRITKKPLKFSDFLIVDSKWLQLFTTNHFLADTNNSGMATKRRLGTGKGLE